MTAKKEEIKRLNLDKPIGIQYLSWAKSFVKGDLGYTSAGEKVSTKLKEKAMEESEMSKQKGNQRPRKRNKK